MKRKRITRKKTTARPRKLLKITKKTMQALMKPDTKIISRCNYNVFTGSAASTADQMYPILNAHVPNAGQCQALNLVSRGTEYNNRIGNKIKMKRLELHYWLWYAGTTVIQPDEIRVAVVYDKQPNGATTISWDQVFQDVASDGNTIDGPTVGINWKNRERFVVLMNNHHNLAAVNATQAIQPLQDYSKPFYTREFIDIDKDTIYGGNSGLASPADINTGTLWLLTQGSFGAGLNGYNLYFSSRVTFLDI